MIDRSLDLVAIERLNQAFCLALDRGTPEAFACLFTEDAIYTNGDRRSNGRSAILDFAQQRIAAAPRTARHLQWGLQISLLGEDEASGLSCCMAFSGVGAPPIDSTVPTLVADFHDLYRREDGQWRFRERQIVPIFTPAARS